MTSIEIVAVALLTVFTIIFIVLVFDRKSNAKLLITFFTNQTKITGEITMVNLKSTQFIEGILQPIDRLGNPAQVEAGSVHFESSDAAVFRVEQDTNNELQVKVIATGVGVAQLNYTADADLGSGFRRWSRIFFL